MGGDMGNNNYVPEFMQEINDYVTNGLYKALFANSKRMTRQEAEF